MDQQNEGEMMLRAERRGDYDNSHSKDAFIVRGDGVRAGVFLDEAKEHVSVVVDMPNGGALCYSVPFAQFVDALRGHLPAAAELARAGAQKG